MQLQWSEGTLTGSLRQLVAGYSKKFVPRDHTLRLSRDLEILFPQILEFFKFSWLTDGRCAANAKRAGKKHIFNVFSAL